MTDQHTMPLFDDGSSREPIAPEHPPENASPVSTESDAHAAPDDVAHAPAAPAVTEDQVKAALRKVKDPELNLNILDLGLVYTISVDGSTINIDMSLTSPGCPSGPEIMTNAEQTLRALPGVADVTVNLVWSPFWSPDRIEPRIRAYLGL